MKLYELQGPGGIDALALVDKPVPHPGKNEVLVRLTAASLNYRDLLTVKGGYGSRQKFPLVPLSDGAGVVEAVGDDDDDRLRAGADVYTSGSITGTYAEAAICPAQQVHPLPATVSHAEGAALGVPYATAWRALFQRAAARPGESVLVHGASGAVGLATVQFATAAGLPVYGTAGTVGGRALVRAQGATHVVDHGDPAHGDQLLALTGGRGFDLVVELRADTNLGLDLRLLAAGGRAIVVGSRGPVEVNPRDLMQREADVRGLLLHNAPADELTAAYEAIERGLTAGDARPVIARTLPLADAAEAHRALAAGHVDGKLVLVP